ncbi:MAG TPA: aminotransferase class V-fold PLP-dependent enzyme, partial [Ilumatobacteraceae bacterium]|nr:aminotransferase class V-fold PLP-dependent enzyme [Ilumatobacteraceae bacterium]
VGASSIYGGSWLEGGGAVFAENEALRYIADLVGLPKTAGGVFVSGGTAGNLSALIAARFRWRHRADGAYDRTRGLLLTGKGAHSSVASAARAMDADVVLVPADEQGRMWGTALRETFAALSGEDRQRAFAIVTTAGTTNAGVIDDLAGVAEVCKEFEVWMHVDGAYGGAGLAAPSVRDRYHGIEHADSFIVDPHKWLFAPFDCCALVYRDPIIGRAAHTQHAEYLDVLHAESATDPMSHERNPSDLAHHLTRRARGLPFWFSLATYGTDAYREAIETTLTVTRDGAKLIADSPHLDLIMDPELSTLVFRRVGWNAADYATWSDRMLDEGIAFVTPTSWNGEVVLRLCIVNPLTSLDDLRIIVDSLA